MIGPTAALLACGVSLLTLSACGSTTPPWAAPGGSGTTQTQIAGFTLVVVAEAVSATPHPKVSREQATQLALKYLGTRVHGWERTASAFEPRLHQLFDSHHQLVYSTYGGPERPQWALFFDAPSQGGYQVNVAYVIVDADSGRITAAAQSSSNPS